MGRFINPSNDGMRAMLRSEYVDKTGLIGLMNNTLDSARKLVLVSRPRRFDKSYAAKMLVAYYSYECNSRALFEGLSVARTADFEQHLNAYNVVYLDMTEVIHAAGVGNTVPQISRMLLPELRGIVADAGVSNVEYGGELTSALFDVVQHTGRKFVFVVDEWDAVYRLAKDDQKAQDSYAEWLHALFKGGVLLLTPWLPGPSLRASFPLRSAVISRPSRILGNIPWCAQATMPLTQALPHTR